MLAVLAPLAVLACELAAAVAWPLALLGAGHGAWLVWRERRRPARQLLLAPLCDWQARQHAGPGQAGSLDGQPLQGWRVRWRGPLAFLDLIEAGGQCHRLVWWPDTLPRPRRRELRLAAVAPGASRRRVPMAP